MIQGSIPIALCDLAAALLLTDAAAAAQSRRGDRTVIGLAAIHAPAYEGAKTYRLMPFPVIDVTRGRFFLSGREGAGVTLLDKDGVKLSTAVTYMAGYRGHDAPRGIGRLAGSAGARLAVEAPVGRAVLGLSATQALSGGVDGALAEASLALPIRASARVMVIPSLSATFADGAYTRAYFGVSADQARASGLRVYRPGGGLKDVAASVTASYRLNERVRLGATAAISALAGDAKHSPIVVHATRPAMVLSAAYSF